MCESSLREILDEAERIAQCETMMLPTIEHLVAQNKRIKELEKKLEDTNHDEASYLSEAH